jgi:hypothetical protein
VALLVFFSGAARAWLIPTNLGSLSLECLDWLTLRRGGTSGLFALTGPRRLWSTER